MTPKQKAPMVTLVVIGAVVLSYIGLTRKAQADPDRFASGVVSALNAGDSGRLSQCISQAELEMYHIQRDDAKRVIEDYYLGIFPHGTTYEIVNKVPDGPDGRNTMVEISTSGATNPLVLFVQPLEGMQTDPSLLSTLVMNAAMQKCFPMANGKDRSERKLRAFDLIGRVEGPKLTSLGLKGLVRSPSEGLLPWGQWVSLVDTRLASLK